MEAAALAKAARAALDVVSCAAHAAQLGASGERARLSARKCLEQLLLTRTTSTSGGPSNARARASRASGASLSTLWGCALRCSERHQQRAASAGPQQNFVGDAAVRSVVQQCALEPEECSPSQLLSDEDEDLQVSSRCKPLAAVRHVLDYALLSRRLLQQPGLDAQRVRETLAWAKAANGASDKALACVALAEAVSRLSTVALAYAFDAAVLAHDARPLAQKLLRAAAQPARRQLGAEMLQTDSEDSEDSEDSDDAAARFKNDSEDEGANARPRQHIRAVALTALAALDTHRRADQRASGPARDYFRKRRKRGLSFWETIERLKFRKENLLPSSKSLMCTGRGGCVARDGGRRGLPARAGRPRGRAHSAQEAQNQARRAPRLRRRVSCVQQLSP